MSAKPERVKPSKQLDRKLLITSNPEVFRKGVVGAVATLCMLFLLFGIDFLDWFFLESSGVSVLQPVRRFINESASFKLLILLLWGWYIFDFALLGGMVLITAPFRRFITVMKMAPEDLEPFQSRGGDQDFQPIADAYNELIVRMQIRRFQVLDILNEGVQKKYTAKQIRDRIVSII